MSAHIEPGQEENNAPELADSPGRRLRVARQSRGLEVESIASELHLGAAMIESLEHDDYDALPGEVFIVGYIRKYARVVGLDPEPLVAAYHQTVPNAARAWLLPRSGARARPAAGSGHPIVGFVSIGVFILVAALTFDWWQSRQLDAEPPPPGDTTTEPEASPEAPTGEPSEVDPGEQAPGIADADVTEAPAAPPPPQAQTEIPSAQPESGNQPGPAGGERPVVQSDTVGRTAAGEDAPAEPTQAAQDGGVNAQAASPPTDDEAAATAQAGEIVMAFEGPCWVDVRDSKREYKLFGEMKKGDRHVLEGQPPYSVILGNAAAVTITVDGNPFDLSGISHGNVARFTLDPKETP